MTPLLVPFSTPRTQPTEYQNEQLLFAAMQAEFHRRKRRARFRVLRRVQRWFARCVGLAPDLTARPGPTDARDQSGDAGGLPTSRMCRDRELRHAADIPPT